MRWDLVQALALIQLASTNSVRTRDTVTAPVNFNNNTGTHSIWHLVSCMESRYPEPDSVRILLPGELSPEVEENVQRKPELVEIRCRIAELKALNGGNASITAERLKYRKALVQFCLSGLKEYQNIWIPERRDHGILKKGKATFKLCQETTEALVSFHKEVFSFMLQKIPRIGLENKCWFKKLKEDFLDAANEFLFWAKCETLVDLEQHGSRELFPSHLCLHR